MGAKRKLWKYVGVIGLSIGILAGCGDSEASSSAKNEITFWNPFTGPDGKNMQAMVNEYNKTNPEYKIKNVSLKEGDMYTKIPTIVNSKKNIPDLTIVHAERIKQFKDNDMLTSYNELLTDFPEINGDNYVAEAWKIGELDSERYSIPLDIHTFGLYYNKDLVDKYLPTALDDNIVTFDEIKQVGEKAQKDKIRTLGVTWLKPNFLSLYAQNGGELTEDGIQPTLVNQAAKDTFNLWRDYVKAGYTTKDGEDPTQMFLTGKVVFLPEGIWMQNQIKESKVNWGLTNAPQLSDDLSKAVNWSSSHQFVMLKDDSRSDEKEKGVVEFLDWVRDNSMEWAKSGQNPATLSLLENEEYKAMPQSFFLATPEQQATLKIFDYKYNGYVSELLDSKAGDVVFSKAETDKALEDMEKEISAKVAKDNTNK
ncbi:extracellular solute-binding protein [Cytobacillus oceanisediminis]|uniref:Extracellular solute-binding protein n=2 Tax=Niallia TaxID=2837506 RepID=A0A941JP95_NIACI|nr:MULTISPECIES: extracellular solute-binding protein [Bacillaceae]MBQ6448401.1 extracellular solute-binding protein [Bacillus sp. (in: firmicutes)]MDU1846855.1 extracellular solute-binding protein [Niallia nealsonii]MBZ9532775.1 extracellular solute-binding protein [Cytobacillus oceanisediminis]MCB5235297.1 extracellular solute-binding protein [Niallia circulans]MED3791960.1 extracellular solute-binding protein [Niallia alba]